MDLLKKWVTKNWWDFRNSPSLNSYLLDFLEDLGSQGREMQEKSALMTSLIDEMEEKCTQIEEMRRSFTLTKRLDTLISINLDPEILAMQLCLYDYRLIKAVHPIEYLNKTWNPKATGEAEETLFPNLSIFIDRFELESYWAATELCSEKDLKKRIKLLRTFILTCKSCLEKNNYFSLFAIFYGLNLQPVGRLKKTWEVKCIT
jgi:hypothetical protein